MQARFWQRHQRIGVVLSCTCALLVLVYATSTAAGPHRGGLVAVGSAIFAGSLALLRVPVRALVLGRWGGPFFYGWSLALTAVVSALAVYDGGAGSALTLLLVLTLTYAAVAYPPVAVGALGAVMVVADGLVHLSGPEAQLSTAVVHTALMSTATAMAVWAAHNQADAQHQRALMARTLETLAATDPLTGCLNRRAFTARLEVGIAEPRPVSTLYVVDLDGFKAVNDTCGHHVGDEVLVAVAAAVRAVAREVDSVARLGGDEFAVLCRQREEPERARLAAALRAAVAAAGRPHGVTASVGYTVLRPDDAPSDALQRADRAVYVSKGAGGDRVHTC
ncbi:GGDEF domain-containing protein [Kineococcus terrestris]|uniref:GGDEF domain-containing protein n=1 Tax=Kineococcus terrestris TaxID=2044856 RepID=UPI0034DB72C5